MFLLKEAKWMEQAMCRTDEGRELCWFTAEEDSPSHDSQWEPHRRLCATCPVRQQCLDDADEVDAKFTEGRGFGYHFRAGLTPRQRYNRAERIAKEARRQLSMTRAEIRNEQLVGAVRHG